MAKKSKNTPELEKPVDVITEPVENVATDVVAIEATDVKAMSVEDLTDEDLEALKNVDLSHLVEDDSETAVDSEMKDVTPKENLESSVPSVQTPVIFTDAEKLAQISRWRRQGRR